MYKNENKTGMKYKYEMINMKKLGGEVIII